MQKPDLAKIETMIERGLFASRWLMAPLYVGLAFSMLALVYSFVSEIAHIFWNITSLSANEVILGVLALIDISLAANLLLMVTFAGYDNFVSKMNTEGHRDHPEWKDSIDFTTLKMKLISSIVAISGIHLLKTFMDVGKASEGEVKWMVIIHITFVGSGVMLALMDWISAKSKKV